MGLIVSIIVIVIMSAIAAGKGFRWWLWAIAGGVPGFIVLLCLPSAKADGIDDDAREKRSRRGNTVGGVISAVAIVGLLIFVPIYINAITY
jgi:hypothetical protein